MDKLKSKEVWFVTGSQHLYGPQTLKQVAADSSKIAAALDKSPKISRKVVFKPVLTTPDQFSNSAQKLTTARNASGS